MYTSKIKYLFTPALLAVVLFTAVQAQVVPDPGTLRYARGSDFQRTGSASGSIDPAACFSSGCSDVVDAMCANIARVDVSGQTIGEAAQPPTIVDHLDGTKTYTFNVNPGFTFEDGTPIQASHLKATIERATNGGNLALAIPGFDNFTWASYYWSDIWGEGIVGMHERWDGETGPLASIVANDTSGTLSITTEGASGDFYPRLGIANFSCVVADDPVNPTRIVEMPDTNPSGPYKFESYPNVGPDPTGRFAGEHASAVLVKRAGAYPGTGRNAFDRVEFTMRLEGQQQQDGLILDGSYDAAGYPGVNLASLIAGDAADPAYQILQEPQRGAVNMVQLNSLAWPMCDQRVRRAINLGFDRAKYLAESGNSISRSPTDNFLPAGIPGHETNSLVYPVAHAPGQGSKADELKEARGLLKDGVSHPLGDCRPPKGENPLLLVYVAGVDPRDTLNPAPGLLSEQAFLSQLKAIGFNVEVQYRGENFDAADLIGELDWDLVSFGWFADYADPANFLNTFFDSSSAYNFGGYSNYDEELRAASVLLGSARITRYQELNQLITEDGAALATYSPVDFGLFSDRIDPACVAELVTGIRELCFKP